MVPFAVVFAPYIFNPARVEEGRWQGIKAVPFGIAKGFVWLVSKSGIFKGQVVRWNRTLDEKKKEILNGYDRWISFGHMLLALFWGLADNVASLDYQAGRILRFNRKQEDLLQQYILNLATVTGKKDEAEIKEIKYFQQKPSHYQNMYKRVALPAVLKAAETVRKVMEDKKNISKFTYNEEGFIKEQIADYKKALEARYVETVAGLELIKNIPVYANQLKAMNLDEMLERIREDIAASTLESLDRADWDLTELSSFPIKVKERKLYSKFLKATMDWILNKTNGLI